ncbi:MAG: glutaminase A [Terrimicrobiaceae bacterium]|nr:glutaminase A [Terrimicrobiaceae bacterium]
MNVSAILDLARERFAGVAGGEVADYIPALAEADPHLFGLAFATTGGDVSVSGAASHEVSIQSVSKPFVFALVCQEIGEDAAREKLGANSTGLPFNSVIAIERNGTTNPMVNAGAIAATSLIPGRDREEKWDRLREGLSRFAGRDLELDRTVYESEMAANHRNRGIARLLEGHQRIYSDPDEAVDLYTRQCSLRVSARDLAVMASVLANEGVHPLSGENVLDPVHCHHVLAVMVTAGLYETSGDWLYETGLPAKSGVSGGFIGITPGVGGLGIVSPPLDPAGNSVRATAAAKWLAGELGLNIFCGKRR